MVASISVSRSKDYLLKDYYHRDHEAPGVWIGEGSKRIGLSGEVNRQDFNNVWQGYKPDSTIEVGQEAGKDKKLVQNAGSSTRKAGWDITYSAPKSVSIVWGLGDDKLRADIEQAQLQATKDATQYLEENAAYTRRGRAGATHEKTEGLVSSAFLHKSSREGDMQIHTHVQTFNLATRTDGSTGSIESQYLYDHKMAAGAVYDNSLSHNMEQLGFQIARKEKGSWELKGVTEKSLKGHSKRTTQIENYLQTNELEDTARNREKAALATRKPKPKETEGALTERWHRESKLYGFTREDVQRIRSHKRDRSEIEHQRAQRLVANRVVKKSTEQDSTFRARDVDRLIARESIGHRMSYSDFKQIKHRLMSSGNVVQVEGDRFTTKRQLRLESTMSDRAQKLNDSKLHPVRSEDIFAAIKKRKTMTREQKKALTHVTAPGDLKAVTGYAGTGKSYFLGAANEVWTANGYRVQGLAPTGKASSGLQEGSGIKSSTIDSLFWRIDKAKQEQKPQNYINKNTVLVVDEAGMIGTEKMTRLLSEAEKAKAKVVLTGDANQLQSIECGGAFYAISKAHGSAKITEVMRQRDKWAREATVDFAEGRTKKAIAAYEQRGLIAVQKTKLETKRKVIDDWSKAGAAEKPGDHLILCTTNEEVKSLNKAAQKKRLDKEHLMRDRHISLNGEQFFEKDRIIFKKNNRNLSVSNGTMATVDSIDSVKKTITATLDGSGKKTTFSTESYRDVSLGYAMTTHKAQGVTANRVYCVTSSSKMQDQQLSYVQASRSREQTRLYATAKSHATGIKQLEKSMATSNQKQLAIDLRQKAKSRNRLTVGQSRKLSTGKASDFKLNQQSRKRASSNSR